MTWADPEGRDLARLTAAGILPHHVLDTLIRLTAGFALAALVGVAIGFAMGRSRRAEDIFLPLVSIGAPIPGLAYAPLFLLWFGLGGTTTVLARSTVTDFSSNIAASPKRSLCAKGTFGPSWQRAHFISMPRNA